MLPIVGSIGFANKLPESRRTRLAGPSSTANPCIFFSDMSNHKGCQKVSALLLTPRALTQPQPLPTMNHDAMRTASRSLFLKRMRSTPMYLNGRRLSLELGTFLPGKTL